MNPRFSGEESLAFRTCSCLYDIKYVLKTTTNLNLTYALLEDLLNKTTKELSESEFEHYTTDNLYRGKSEGIDKKFIDSIVGGNVEWNT